MLQADQYAPETEVHKYLHSRLASFDIATLYELHYQMITLGKVGPSPLTAAAPLSCPSSFFVHAHFVHAYDGRLDYAVAVSVDTDIHTHRSLSSKPTSSWLSLANAFAGIFVLSTLSVVTLHLGLDAACVVLHMLVMKEWVSIG